MELIPLISMKKRKIFLENNRKPTSLKDFLQIVEGKKRVYILDLDGIEKDKPNLCTFQRVSSLCDLWVDFGPRDLGDIVDATMTGATDITIRNDLCPKLNIENIKEITENSIYSNFDFSQDTTIEKWDGIVNFNSRKYFESNNREGSCLKKAGLSSKIYSYESNIKNRAYWDNFNLKGLLVDFNKIKEFKDAFRK